MGKFIHFFTADGTLNMPDEDKNLFRLWAQNQIASAFPDYDVEVKKEHSAYIFTTSESEPKQKKGILQFVNNLLPRWEKINKKR